MQTNPLLPDGNDSRLSRHSREWMPLPSEETTMAKIKTVAKDNILEQVTIIITIHSFLDHTRIVPA